MVGEFLTSKIERNSLFREVKIQDYLLATRGSLLPLRPPVRTLALSFVQCFVELATHHVLPVVFCRLTREADGSCA